MHYEWTVPEEFALALKVGRLFRGYSYGHVARGAGVPTWRLRAFEDGHRPTVDEWARVWRFLSTDPPRLATTTAEPRTMTPAAGGGGA